MTAKTRLTTLALLTAASGAFLSSCAYDPYGYSYGSDTSMSSSVGYSSNGHVSSSIFISTGSPRWGYDPHCRSYYDYTRHCYYDPYLNGYYPRGYRPPIIVGVPHPHGWHSGLRHCPPPSHVREHKLADHGNRYKHYTQLNQPWCRDLRVSPHSNHHSSHLVSNNNGSHNPTPSHSNSIWNRNGQSVSNNHNGYTSRNTSPNSNVQRHIGSTQVVPTTRTGIQPNTTPNGLHSGTHWKQSTGNSKSNPSNYNGNSNRYSQPQIHTRESHPNSSTESPSGKTVEPRNFQRPTPNSFSEPSVNSSKRSQLSQPSSYGTGASQSQITQSNRSSERIGKHRESR